MCVSRIVIARKLQITNGFYCDFGKQNVLQARSIIFESCRGVADLSQKSLNFSYNFNITPHILISLFSYQFFTYSQKSGGPTP